MVQGYLNDISPTLHGPNKLKTSGKPLRIADLQPPASGQNNPATLYVQKFQTVILSGDIISIPEPNQDRYWVEDPRMLADIDRIEVQDQGDQRSE